MSHLAARRFADDTRVFNKKKSLTRRERFATRDKESREKLLIEQRPARHGQKFINYGRDLTAASESSGAFITEQDRFFTDFAAEEKRRRSMRVAEREKYIEQKRFENASKEEERWQEMDERWSRTEERQLAKMARGCPSNESSVPYNPLTLEYADSNDGQMLRYHDSQIMYRAALRAENLNKHQNANGFNPITGADTYNVRVPNRPSPPSHGQ